MKRTAHRIASQIYTANPIALIIATLALGAIITLALRAAA